jgi:plasmid replication initiation protein
VVRKNEKQQIISYENSISKSNEFSMAKLNQGLTLNQMQLLAFSIYSTQQNGKTEFHKADFEKKFNLTKYNTSEAQKDVPKLTQLQFSLVNLENNYVDYLNVFQRIRYKDGVFLFKWSEDMLPHILELKEKYITVDLTITSQFKSGFSWILYDYLKAHYGYWHKILSKEAFMKLFCVEDKKTYQANTGRFKKTVLDVAIAEVNQYTEFEVHYTEIKEGRSIVGFDLIWSSGKTISSATKKQIRELKTIVDAVSASSLDYLTKIEKKDNRERAAELIREVESYDEFTAEPICITKEFADTLIKKANTSLVELERLVEYDRTASKVPFYNWLDERE